MQSQEHIFAIVEPNAAGEATLDIARDVVARGGRATVTVLLDRQTTRDIRAFADSENLSIGHGGAIYTDRLAEQYATRVGGDTATVINPELAPSGRDVLETAVRVRATMIAIPRSLMARREWRVPLGRSSVPVLITPPRAA